MKIQRLLFASALMLAAWVLPAHAAGPATPALLDGMLVRTVSDPKVYYLQGGTRRWIDSEAAFLAQGFAWSDVSVVDDAWLASYQDGAAISGTAKLGLPLERVLLPDLTPVAPNDIRYATIGGKTVLKFTGAFWNRGKGAFELNTQQNSGNVDGDFPAMQRLYRPDGSFVDKYAGTLFWHAIHKHYHFDEFGQYRLELVRPDAGGASVPISLTQKTTFCMRDDDAIAPPAEGPDQPRTYMGCGGFRQGVSVGWADVYPYSLPDQYFDVTGFPAGIYKLSFKVDLESRFTETRRDNDLASTFIAIDPAKRSLRVVAAAAAYATPANVYPDGMLIQGEGDPRVYVMHGNKKRHLANEQVFLSYGFAWNQIYVLPKSIVDVIPDESMIRLQGTSQIYFLNAHGYRRHIISPAAFASYATTVADVNPTEFAGYPETALIRVATSADVYRIDGAGKRLVGKLDGLAALGLDAASVQVVSFADFNSYQTLAEGQAPPVALTVDTVAEGLDVPWDIAFLPGGDMLVTERTGTLKRLGAHAASISIPNIPKLGEGGLMGIALHPQFAQNNYVYLYFTVEADGKHNRISRFTLDGDTLKDEKIILDGIPSALYHDGGQVAFGPDGMLYISTGDSEVPALAQDLSSLAGKILRLTPEGGIPADNPFGTAVWSYGHRNVQGLAWDDQGRLWATEHGPTAGVNEPGTCCRDELNLIEKGKNYGWPIITGDQTRDGMVTPKANSGATGTWAPSGLAFAGGKLFFAGLKGATLYEAQADAQGNIVSIEPNFANVYGRLRAVVLGPDGYLYFTTSNRDGRGTPKTGDDKILKVHPDYFRNAH